MPVSTLVCPPADSFAQIYSLPDVLGSTQKGALFSPTGKSASKRKFGQTVCVESALKQFRSQKDLHAEGGSAYKNIKSPVLARTDS